MRSIVLFWSKHVHERWEYRNTATKLLLFQSMSRSIIDICTSRVSGVDKCPIPLIFIWKFVYIPQKPWWHLPLLATPNRRHCTRNLHTRKVLNTELGQKPWILIHRKQVCSLSMLYSREGLGQQRSYWVFQLGKQVRQKPWTSKTWLWRNYLKCARPLFSEIHHRQSFNTSVSLKLRDWWRR